MEETPTTIHTTPPPTNTLNETNETNTTISNNPQDSPLQNDKIDTCKFRMSNETRQRIVDELISQLNKNGKPKYGLLKQLAIENNISERSIKTLWKVAREQLQRGVVIDVTPKRVGVVGRKPGAYDLSRLPEIPLSRRTNIRSLASALGMTKSTTHNLVKQGLIRPHTSAIKPTLTEDNKKKRVAFCLTKLAPNNTCDNNSFVPMHDHVHIDEKWFYMTQVKQRYYLHEEEPEPYRCCKSKGFIAKVMFLCVVARPDFGPDGEVLFDGKIGIFPFMEMVPAQRRSKNREAGTLEVKPIQSITKEVIKTFMIEKVLPAIKEKWPAHRSKNIIIQQDNARPHLSPSDPDFIEAANKDGFSITLTCQPPNSPDLNVLDLGWFRAIQTIQNELAPRNVSELVDVVQLAFNQLNPTSLNYVWLTLQNAMISILATKGGNYYKVPHMAKERLAREGRLPISLQVLPETFHEALLYLSHQAICT